MQAHTKLWYLEKFNLKQILSLEERKRLAGTAVMEHVPRKEILYFSSDAADCVYILKEGKVKIYRHTPEGKEIILNIVYPGELFGELGITGQQEREEVAEVMEDAVLCVIKLEQMQEHMQNMPSLNTEVLKGLGSKVKKIQSRLESLICKNAEQRIRCLISELAREHGRIIAGDPEQVEVKLALTHADISKLTATCRQSVSTLLKELESKEIIKYDRGRILVKNLSLL